jgi:hypothetical protein
VGTGWDGSIAVSGKSKNEIFFAAGLDMDLLICPSGKSVPQIVATIKS